MLEKPIGAHLEARLGYVVATFLRTPQELASIAAHRPFAKSDCDRPGHYLFVAFHGRAADAAAFVSWLRRFRELVWRLLVTTVGTCMRYRVTGLAAEAAFFAVLSVPPLIFAMAGAIVMYDRVRSLGRFAPRPIREGGVPAGASAVGKSKIGRKP